jgi:hypothetical protein
VPEKLWPLLPYAEFWGIADSDLRIELVEQAPPDIRRNLKEVISVFEDDLEEWLVGDDDASRNPTDEYVAFAALIMAADYA